MEKIRSTTILAVLHNGEVAIGGDGTISEVVNGLALSNIPLAIIPLGTGNIIAHELGIPFDLEEACALIADHRHKLRHLDLMQVGDRYFISHISLGIYSLIIGSIRPEDKRRFGRLVYIWEAIRRLLQRKRWRFNIRIDSSTLSIRASLVLVANAGAVGLSSLRWGEHISPDDQHLALCIIKGETLSDYLRLLWNMARNRHYTDKNITYFNAKQHISIETKQDLPVRADGEIIGESRVSIQLVPTAINIITR